MDSAYGQVPSQSVPDAKSILVLHSFEPKAPVFAGTDKGLSKTLLYGGILIQNQFFVSLDLRRNPGFEYRRLMVEEMRVRSNHRKFDIIITMCPEALEFVLKDCRDIFDGVPILAMYLPQGFVLPNTDRPMINRSGWKRLRKQGQLPVSRNLLMNMRCLMPFSSSAARPHDGYGIRGLFLTRGDAE